MATTMEKCDCGAIAKWVAPYGIKYCFDCVMGCGIAAVSVTTGRPVTTAQINRWFSKQHKSN